MKLLIFETDVKLVTVVVTRFPIEISRFCPFVSDDFLLGIMIV